MTSRNVRTSSSAMTKLFRQLRKQGYQITLARSGHYHIKLDGRLIAVTSASPKDGDSVARLTRKQIKGKKENDNGY